MRQLDFMFPVADADAFATDAGQSVRVETLARTLRRRIVTTYTSRPALLRGFGRVVLVQDAECLGFQDSPITELSRDVMLTMLKRAGKKVICWDWLDYFLDCSGVDVSELLDTQETDGPDTKGQALLMLLHDIAEHGVHNHHQRILEHLARVGARADHFSDVVEEWLVATPPEKMVDTLDCYDLLTRYAKPTSLRFFGRRRGLDTTDEDIARANELFNLAERLRDDGTGLRAIAKELTRRGFETPTGKREWHAQQVKNLLARLDRQRPSF